MIAISILCALWGFGIYMLVRNEWVYRQRIKLIYGPGPGTTGHMSYNAMMMRFWVWDVEKLKK